MGTKNNPGPHDCYAAALPDEPMFVLLGRDPLAADLVETWAMRREGTRGPSEKVEEARACARAMRTWRHPEPPEAEPEKKPAYLCWADLETTGLDPEKDAILEIAWALTQFEYPYEPIGIGGTSRLVHQRIDPRTYLTGTVLEMHTKNGLLDDLDREHARLAGAPTAIRLEETHSVSAIEQELLFLSQDWPLDKDRRVLLAGNSVAQFDLPFLRKHMPTFAARLSHRVFDASAFYRNLRSLGMPEISKVGEPAHRAAKDVEASIDLARRCARWVLERTAP